MPQPTPFDRSFSFTDWEAESPSAVPPGTSVDAEFDAVELTLGETLANLALIQRDDGALANGSVGLDQLASSVITLLMAAGGWTLRGLWTPLTEYDVGDIVINVASDTAVCQVAHTSEGVDFDDDYALGYWVVLLDASGSTPANGSVTTAKIAPGAVTASKLNITTLDLTGSIRGQGGIAAGTAPAGSLMHAKLAAGDVLVKAERTTDAQGVVGFQILGVSLDWGLQMAASDNDLFLTNGTTSIVFREAGGMDVQGGTLRAIAGVAPTEGVGAGLHYASNVGYLTAYDYDGAVWKDLKLRGKDVFITAGGVDVMQATSTGADFLLQPTFSGDALGYLGIPQVIDNDARTLSNADNGLHIYSENVAGQTITIPLDMDGDVDFATLIINDGTNSIALNAGTGAVTIQLAGGALGNRTIAANGWCFVKRVKANHYFVGGKGTS
jgi:hypothetical protein